MRREEKINLICRNCEEILTVADLKELIDNKKRLVHYIGFEISGLVHLGTGLMSMGKIADFLKAGVSCQIFLADFHSFLNNKLGADWEKIRWATKNYFQQALVAALRCWGVKENQVKFILGRDHYRENIDHWQIFMEVGKKITLSRNLRSISIMGKKAGRKVDMATLFYPPLQVADIFSLGVNLAHAGMDQRKAHVVARAVGKKIGKWRPVAVHQALIAGLGGPEKGKNDEKSLKMSKSQPRGAIFIHDSPDEIKTKMRTAYGPPAETEFNPLINWTEKLVFWGEKRGWFEIKRPNRYGGKVIYERIDDLIDDYKKEKLYPLDLKNALAEWLIAKLEPARRYFKENAQAKEGLKKMQEWLENS